MEMVAVEEGGCGRWRVVVEWRGEVRDWRRVSTEDLGVVLVVGGRRMAAKL